MPIDDFSNQANQLVTENRRLRLEVESVRRLHADMKQRYDTVAAGMNDMIEDHRKIERDLQFRVDRAESSEKEVAELLLRVADMIQQAFRAREGEKTPETMPPQTGRHIQDARLPELNPAH